MPKFRIRVVETVTMDYDTVEIEAETEEAADEIAEEMRCQGSLGPPRFISVDEIDYELDQTAAPTHQAGAE